MSVSIAIALNTERFDPKHECGRLSKETISIDEKRAPKILLNKFSFEFEKFLKINFSMFMCEFSILSCCVREICMRNVRREKERRIKKRK